MMRLWHESEAASGNARHQVRTITKSAFLALSEQERGRLLEDFLLVKDTNVPREFFPPFVKLHSSLCSKSQTFAFPDQLQSPPWALHPTLLAGQRPLCECHLPIRRRLADGELKANYGEFVAIQALHAWRPSHVQIRCFPGTWLHA
jgi:hypothetical protein